MKESETKQTVLTPKDLLEHWQGHRRLTRKAIEAFPDDKLFTFSIGGMRTFGEIANELLLMGAPPAFGFANPGQWISFKEMETGELNINPKKKKDILILWDWSTEKINKYWKMVSAERLQETETVYSQFEGTMWSHLFYLIDNEIHHRGQAYVYLRSLGIEPPLFWER